MFQTIATLTYCYLISIDKSFTDGELTEARSLQVNADKCTRHWWVARQEQRLTLFQLTSKTITDGVCAQVWPIIPHTYHYCCWKIPSCKKFHTSFVIMCSENMNY